ncbi:long-chain fatty acid transport protein 6-like [Lytechinus variegatus]|uniref:long-chain fatty acid transport protein 6-like n=1 Tax=Lytechinus variegatus TaxID=7654 RepID=UPI001BB289D1|nr:long-chain fatty acid transport protein 6-like [Lytechinus variegatus]
MAKARGIGPPAALAAAVGAIPAGYLWLRSRYPTFWKDVQFLKTFGRLNSELQALISAGNTIIDIFEQRALENPDHPCILFEKEAYTYGEVRANAARVARWVTAADPTLKKGDTICMLLQNSPVFIWTWLGFLKKGIVTSLLNFNLKPSAILECIRVSEAKKLVFGIEFLGIIEQLMPDLLALNVELWMVNDSGMFGVEYPVEVVPMDVGMMSGDPLPNVPMRMEEISSYIFTSGTTGLPKPATIPHRKILRGLFLHYFSNLTPDDVYYVVLPLYHSAALFIAVCTTFFHGGTVALAKKFSASHFWDDVRRHNATGFQYIGELCRYLIAQPKRMDDGKYPRKMKIALGNGLRPEIWQEFQNRFNIEKIVEIYAATEGNAGFINFDGKVGSIGRYPWILKKLIGGVELVEYDFATGEPKRGKDGFCKMVPIGQTGLAMFKIDDRNPYTGYKGPKERSEKKIVRDVKTKGDAYFNTGDLLRMDEEDYIYFMDRIGDTFRWKGENVSTMEVSQVLSSHPDIIEANVYGVHIPGQDGRAGMAAIVPNKGTRLDFGDVYSHVASLLPDYACPKFLRVMKEIEITGTFKHKKTDLVKEGFDIDSIPDEIYIIEPSQKAYVPFTTRHLSVILSGHSKL